MAARGREGESGTRWQRIETAWSDAWRRQHGGRRRSLPEGWLDDKFVPLGFEADGAWGPSAVWAFEEVVAVHAEIRDPTQASGHLAVNFGAHWRKAIGAALAGGQAAVCLSSAMPDARAIERASTEASQEFHPDRA